MPPDSRAGQKDVTNNVLDAKTLLAVDGGMITGILFFLTLTSFLTGTESLIGRFIVGILTVTIIGFFAASALLIIPIKLRLRLKRALFYVEDKEPNLKRARIYTYYGFYFAPVYLGLIVFSPLLPPLLQGQGLQGVENQMEDIERECVKNPEQFNVSATPWKCSEFSLESLAERCARNPERFNMIKSECHQLIPPSS